MYTDISTKKNMKKQNFLPLIVLAIQTTNLYAQEDTTFITDKEIETVVITDHNKIRKMKEASMPLSVISTRPSFFYSFE